MSAKNYASVRLHTSSPTPALIGAAMGLAAMTSPLTHASAIETLSYLPYSRTAVGAASYGVAVYSDASHSRFEQLVREWRTGCPEWADIRDMAMHQAYQSIIGMGRVAVPLLLRELQREPDHWFWALSAITGEDPVPEEDRGRLERMAAAWLRWGREHDLV